MPADIFDAMFETVGADFEALMPGLQPVTVAQIDPDTGAAAITTVGVPALKRTRHRQPFGVSGGELGQDECRFVMRASTVGFPLKVRDQITDATGVTWIAERVEVIGFQHLYAVDCTIKR